MRPTFSIVVNHTPWRTERREALAAMVPELVEAIAVDGAYEASPIYINATDYRGTEWQVSKVAWALEQWTWSLRQPTTHHLFLTDDLHLSPRFKSALEAMLLSRPDVPIGLLSNHPAGPRLYEDGHHGYTTNAWIVGPAYVLPHRCLTEFLAWFDALPGGDWRTPGTKGYRNDDSSLNEWITAAGPGVAWHPLPTIVEHRADLESTVGHGDRFSRERLSWRERRRVVDAGDDFRWVSESWMGPRLEDMLLPEFWAGAAPLQSVGGF